MAFKKGQGGRPKGARNRRTAEFNEVLRQQDFCVPSTFVELYRRAFADYEYYSDLLRANRISPMEDNSYKNLKIAADLAEKIASYAYPKLKSIEQKVVGADPSKDPLSDYSDEELDAL